MADKIQEQLKPSIAEILQETCLAGGIVTPPDTLKRNLLLYGSAMNINLKKVVGEEAKASIHAWLDKKYGHPLPNIRLYRFMYAFVGPTKFGIYQLCSQMGILSNKYSLGARVLLVARKEVVRLELAHLTLISAVTLQLVNGRLELEAGRARRKEIEQLVAAVQGTV
jgi:hypothetical protein